MSTQALASLNGEGAAVGLAERACLTVIHHPDPALLGRCLTLEEGEGLGLGRGGEALGPGALADDRLSRRHVQLTREGRAVRVEDQASRNGTTVNGRRVGVSQLRQGDVLGIGRLLLLFHWLPDGFQGLQHPRVIGESPALAAALAAALRVGAAEGPALIRGEPGTGRRRLAHEVHRAGRRGRPFGVLDCSSGKEPPWDRIRERVGAGTLVLSDFERAPMRFQKAVLDALVDPATPFRLVFTLAHAPRAAAREGLLLPQLADHLGGEAITLPPLRHRPEDILPLVRHFARERAGAPRHVSRRLCLMLMLLRWPGNVAELEQTVHQLVDGQRQQLTLLAPTWLADRVQ